MNEADDNTPLTEEVNNFLTAHDDECFMCRDVNNVHVPEDDVLNRDITIDEMINVIKQFNNGKSGGSDGVIYEMLKHCPITVIEYMHTLFNRILRQGDFPKTWGEAIISPLFKKGSPCDKKNYRGISLLSCIGKTLTKILNNRLMAWVESMGILDDGQCAYRCHRSTNDNIFILYAMIQKYLTRKGGRFYCTFVDFC